MLLVTHCIHDLGENSRMDVFIKAFHYAYDALSLLSLHYFQNIKQLQILVYHMFLFVMKVVVVVVPLDGN